MHALPSAISTRRLRHRFDVRIQPKPDLSSVGRSVDRSRRSRPSAPISGSHPLLSSSGLRFFPTSAQKSQRSRPYRKRIFHQWAYFYFHTATNRIFDFMNPFIRRDVRVRRQQSNKNKWYLSKIHLDLVGTRSKIHLLLRFGLLVLTKSKIELIQHSVGRIKGDDLNQGAPDRIRDFVDVSQHQAGYIFVLVGNLLRAGKAAC